MTDQPESFLTHHSCLAITKVPWDTPKGKVGELPQYGHRHMENAKIYSKTTDGMTGVYRTGIPSGTHMT